MILLEELGIMHRHKIVHMDIKPSNLMWSPSLNKPVFIDFGLTDIIAEECGMKTKTKFKGTICFMSAEMKKLYFGNTGWVDLYYNDLLGFQKSL